MKVLLVLCVVFAISQAEFTEEQQEVLMNYHTECAKETGVDESFVTKARAGEFVEDDTFKKHLFCVSKRLGFQNDSGDLQVDIIKEKMSTVIDDDGSVDQIMEKCAVQEDTPENTAFNTIQCYYHARHGD